MDVLVSRLKAAKKVGIRRLGLRSVCGACLLVVLCGVCHSRSRDYAAATFSIDVDKPYKTVSDVVREVVNNGVIQGTFEYKGDQSLPGADAAQTSSLFRPWDGQGQVFFKVRTNVLSPVHFLNSNDVGTVAVRYVVQELGPNSTRLFLDAVFVENAHHHNHPSDGYVETTEFGVIARRLKELDQQLQAGRQAAGTMGSSSQEGQPRVEVIDPLETGDMRKALADQKAKLDAESGNLHQLESHAQQLRQASVVRVSADWAELKALPYAHSRGMQFLKKGQEVTILATSPYWYRVRSSDGQEGWIYHLLMESQP